MKINKVQVGKLFLVLTLAATALNCKKTTDIVDTGSNTGTDKTYNTLWIPPTLTGTTFNLTLGNSTKQLRTGAVTATYG